MISVARRYVYLFVLFVILLSIRLIRNKSSDFNGKVRILFLVRTSSRFHSSRFASQIETWIDEVFQDVFVVTDLPTPQIDSEHQIATGKLCGVDKHSMSNLCCKTGHDFQIFQRQIRKYDWFCHFDDDQYVNVKNLRKFLSKFDSRTSFYIGRNSWNETLKRKKNPHPRPFWFATLGAGVCLSKKTIQRLKITENFVSSFVNGCLTENYHDDIHLGFMLNYRLNLSLTKTELFHSHLEKNFFVDEQNFLETFQSQITFGFRFPDRIPNFLPNSFDSDPFRMKALHCHLHPQIDWCQENFSTFLSNFNDQETT